MQSVWREFAEKEVRIGQHLKITDVFVQTYNNEKTVSTTGKTEVETMEPSQLKPKENIMADNMEETASVLSLTMGKPIQLTEFP